MCRHHGMALCIFVLQEVDVAIVGFVAAISFLSIDSGTCIV